MAPVALSQTVLVSEHPSTSKSSPTLKTNGVNGASNKSIMNGSSSSSFPSPDPTYPTLHTPLPRTEFSFDSVEDALAAFARGEFLVVMDDEDRENEGDLIAAASMCSTEKMAWMIRHTRCVCHLSHKADLTSVCLCAYTTRCILYSLMRTFFGECCTWTDVRKQWLHMHRPAG